MKKKKKSVLIHMDEDFHNELKISAKQNDRSVTAQVRVILKEALSKEK